MSLKITISQINRFVRWLTDALPRGRSVREYVDTFGGIPINRMIAAAIIACHQVSVYTKSPGSTRHRIRIIKEDSHA